MLKLIAFIAGLFALPQSARAADSGSLLLLGVVRNGHFDSHLSSRLAEHLEHVGEPLVKKARLSATERLCADQECMAQAATREAAEHVMTIQITAEKQAPPFIRLALLDMPSRRLVNKEGICDPCTGDALGLAVESVTDRAFIELRQPPATSADKPTPAPMETPPLPPPSPPVLAAATTPPRLLDPPAGKTSRSRFEGLSRERKIGAQVLGGVSAVALIASIALAATHGQYTDLGCTSSAATNPIGLCRLDNSIPMGIGFSISIAAAAGSLGLLLAPAGKARLMPSQTSNAVTQEN